MSENIRFLATALDEFLGTDRKLDRKDKRYGGKMVQDNL